MAGEDGQGAIVVPQTLQGLTDGGVASAPEIAPPDVVGKEGVTRQHDALGLTEEAGGAGRMAGGMDNGEGGIAYLLKKKM